SPRTSLFGGAFCHHHTTRIPPVIHKLLTGGFMASSISITGIQLQARCGVTETERGQPQPIVVDLTVRCRNERAFQSDQLADTIDYAAITQCVRDTGERQPFALLETLTEHLCQKLFEGFPLTHVKIWVRKIHPPMKDFTGSVGIHLIRSRQEIIQTALGTPSPFLIAQLPRLPQGKVLDVATGRGRHAYFLATHGFTVHGIDRNREALDCLEAQAREAGLLPLTTECIDLEMDAQHPPDLGTETYDVILVFFYLHRPLFPQLLNALKPGGVILYETFLLENHLRRQHPRRKEFCLETNELLTHLQGCHILHYDEGEHAESSQTNRAFTARALARKP
ncbi:MAG: dihydroneopterin aldolase, partial [Nitrospirota bacterium]|nr:dihydroneopterin aldolase [Nitrospirota bacterium]